MTLKELIKQLVNMSNSNNYDNEVMIKSHDENNCWTPFDPGGWVSVHPFNDKQIVIYGQGKEFQNKLDDTG